MLIIIVFILFFWIILLHAEIMEINRAYLGDISSFELRFKEKEKKILELKKQVEYYKGQESCNDYLTD